MKKWQKLSSKIVYDSKYFKVRKDQIKLPTGEKKEWTYWDSRDSAMVIGMTKDKKKVMIKQYRYLVDNEVIEFPSGGLKEKETPQTAAKREFFEETGFLISSRLIKLGSFFETYGQLNRKIHLFFANKVERAKKFLDKNNDDDVEENIKVVLVDLEKAIDLAIKNKIVATGSTLAILLLKEKLKNKKI